MSKPNGCRTKMHGPCCGKRYKRRMAREKSKTGVRVARDLVQSIYERELQPGDRYLSEAEALKEHGVSRATYREATRFLEFQGVLKSKAGPGGGTIVDRPDWNNLASTFALLMQFSGTSLAQAMAARRLLEPAMAAQSARNVTEEQLAAMRRELEIARSGLSEVDSFTPAYRAFWRLMADATGNPVVAELWKALRALIDSGHFVPNEVYRSRLTEKLGTLLDALMERDAESASRIVAELDSEFSERLARDYPQRFNKTVAWSDIHTRAD